MPLYIEVLRAASETATKMLALRSNGTWFNVEVTTDGGKTASVTWSTWHKIVTLNMPSLPPTANMTRGEADRLVAFIGHECCHVLHTDKAAWGNAVAAGARVKYWTNAMEDVRIEHKEIQAGMFPALRSLLGNMTNKLYYDAVTGKGGNNIGKRIVDAPYAVCVLGRIANGYDIPAAANLESRLSPNVSQLVQHALAGLPRCASTADVLALAQELVAMEQSLRKPPVAPPPITPPPPLPPTDDGDGDGDGDGDTSESQSNDAGEGGNDPGTDDSGQDASSDPGAPQGDPGENDAPGEGAAGDPGEGSEAGEGEPTDTDLSDMVKDIAKRNDKCDTRPGNSVSRLNIADNKTVVAGRRPRNSDPVGVNDLKTRLPKNSVLSGQISRLLVSQEQHRVTHRETRGRLDRRAITRMQTDARDVFSQRHDTPGINTALFILVDGSSSMNAKVGDMFALRAAGEPIYTRMMVALTTAWHIAHAAEAATAEVAIGLFRSRGNGATVQLTKPWKVSLADASATIANTDFGGSTPLAPAIMESARLLGEVNATRRILMVLTDGECDYGAAAVKTACKLASDLHDVETVGIGMSCPTVITAFPARYSVNVQDLTQLAGKGLGVLCGMLESVGEAA